MPNPKNENAESGSKEVLRTKPRTATEAFEEYANAGPIRRAKYILRLYVTGSSARSLRAVYNLQKICEEHLPDYSLEVIDIYKNPAAAREEQIIAAPTLIRELPAPLRRLVGDLSNRQKVLVGLDIYHRQDFTDQLNGA